MTNVQLKQSLLDKGKESEDSDLLVITAETQASRNAR